MGELLISKGADIHFSSLLNPTKKILAIEQSRRIKKTGESDPKETEAIII